MSRLENVETQKSFKYLQEVESTAQDLLTAKDTKLQLANTRNKLREALRATQTTEERKTWLEMGLVYVERPTEECEIILREELARADEDLKELQNEIREKTHKLRDLEHEPRLEGFTLKPISVVEAKALHKGFGMV